MSTHKRKGAADEVVNPDEWRTGLRFGLKALNVKSVSAAKSCDNVLLVCLQHNLRKGNADHRHRHPIDQARSALNTVLLGADDPQVAAELARSVFEELGIVPPRNDSIMGVELVFQPPEGNDTPEFYGECLQWARSRYQRLLSAVVHRDQARPHLHVLALAIVDGRLAGADMTSGPNRSHLQRGRFMAHVRATLGLRPDREAAVKPKSLASVFTSTGKGPKTHAEASRRDAQLQRRTGAGSSDLIAQQPHSPPDLIAQQPHSPPDLIAQQPHSPPDLIAPTSYCAAISPPFPAAAEALSAAPLLRVPTMPMTPAPRPDNPATAASPAAQKLRLVHGGHQAASVAESLPIGSQFKGTRCRRFIVPEGATSASPAEPVSVPKFGRAGA